MPRARISSRELTADHIGRMVTVTWPDGRSDVTHSATGELESVTQYRAYATGVLSVGPHELSVEFGGPVEVWLHDEE